MQMKWIGAALIILGCGTFGFSLAANHQREEAMLRQLIGILDFMECELQFHYAPLPDLCRQAGQEAKGPLRNVFMELSQILDLTANADVQSSMAAVLCNAAVLPGQTLENLEFLGRSLGRFDLEGQLSGLEQVRSHCRKDLQYLTDNRDTRLRSYQTLGICAGAAIAILLI